MQFVTIHKLNHPQNQVLLQCTVFLLHDWNLVCNIRRELEQRWILREEAPPPPAALLCIGYGYGYGYDGYL